MAYTNNLGRYGMEVKETAACGIAQREFAIELDNDEFVDRYRGSQMYLNICFTATLVFKSH
jgi:hypothetical protein